MVPQLRLTTGPELRAADGESEAWPPPEWAREGIPTRGHSLVFGVRELIGDDVWGFYEEFLRGSTKETIKSADIRLLQNHDPNYFFARTGVESGPGSYDEHKEDDGGLFHEARLLPTQPAYTLAWGLRTGVVSQMSVAFWPVKWRFARVNADGTDLAGDDDKRGSMLLVQHEEIALTDESYVTYPAYTDTDAALRMQGLSLLAEAAEQRMTEREQRSLIEAMLTGTLSDDASPALRSAVRSLLEVAKRGDPPEREAPPEARESVSRFVRGRVKQEVDLLEREFTRR